MIIYTVKYKDKNGESHEISVGAKDVPTAILAAQELCPDAVKIVVCKPYMF